MSQVVRIHCDGCGNEIAASYLSVHVEGTQGDLCSLPCAQTWLAKEWSKRSTADEADRIAHARSSITSQGLRAVDAPKQVTGEVVDKGPAKQ